MLVHHLWLTVFCTPEDSEELVMDGLLKFFPYDLKDKKIPASRQTATGFEERKIIIISVHLEKPGHINAFLSHLLSRLSPEQKAMLLEQKKSRLDKDNHFFIRFDKDSIIVDGTLEIIDGGNCYHLKMSIASFPASRQNALLAVEKLFSDQPRGAHGY